MVYRRRGRRRVNKKKFVKKTRSDARVKKLAIQAVNSQKVMKRFPNDGLNFQNPSASNEWVCFLPTDIGASGPTAVNQDISRLTNSTWIQRMSGIIDVQIPQTCHSPVEVRKMCGWYKGSSKPNDPQNSSFGATHLQQSFPSRLTRYDNDNFKIVDDINFSVSPHQQLYNPDTETKESLWKPFKIKCSMRLNRTFNYTDANDSAAGTNLRDGLVLNGAYLVGWVPFIAIQMRCPQQAFTAPTGSNPRPVWDYKFTTYFKDNY